jgi:hypothetical protein
MNVFQMKSQPEYIERKNEFLSEGFVCIGYRDIGDLTGLNKDQIRDYISKVYGWESSQLGNHLGIVNTFVNIMQPQDLVLINDNDWVHIGELGEYDYNPQHQAEGTCHRRKVRWITRIEKFKLNEHVKELLRNRSIVTKFKHPTDIAELDKIIKSTDQTINKVVKNDEKTAEKAISVLKKALDSENEDIRVKAAMSLLDFLK